MNGRNMFFFILILILKNIHPLYHTSGVTDYPLTYIIYTHNGDDTLKTPCVTLECNYLVVLISFYIVGYLVYLNTNVNFTLFWAGGILSALLTTLLLLSCKYSDYQMQVTVVCTLCLHFFLHIYFLSTCLCSCAFIQQYLH